MIVNPKVNDTLCRCDDFGFMSRADTRLSLALALISKISDENIAFFFSMPIRDRGLHG